MFLANKTSAKKLIQFVFCLYLLPLLFLFLVAILGLYTDASIPMAMRDPAATARIHPLTGIASNLGALLWAAAATICLFSSTVFRHSLNKPAFSKFLLYSGLLTILLLVDDFFLLHEAVYSFDISEKFVYLGYGCLIIWWAAAFRKFILSTDYIILMVAIAFFGLSIFIDIIQYQIQPFLGNLRIFLEDGFKLLGIVGWLGYFLRCSLSAAKQLRQY